MFPFFAVSIDVWAMKSEKWHQQQQQQHWKVNKKKRKLIRPFHYFILSAHSQSLTIGLALGIQNKNGKQSNNVIWHSMPNNTKKKLFIDYTMCCLMCIWVCICIDCESSVINIYREFSLILTPSPRLPFFAATLILPIVVNYCTIQRHRVKKKQFCIRTKFECLIRREVNCNAHIVELNNFPANFLIILIHWRATAYIIISITATD